MTFFLQILSPMLLEIFDKYSLFLHRFFIFIDYSLGEEK